MNDAERAAVEVIAAHVLACEVAGADYSDQWEELPLIGSRDWDVICTAVEALVDRIDASSAAEFQAAYALFADRRFTDPRAAGRPW